MLRKLLLLSVFFGGLSISARTFAEDKTGAAPPIPEAVKTAPSSSAETTKLQSSEIKPDESMSEATEKPIATPDSTTPAASSVPAKMEAKESVPPQPVAAKPKKSVGCVSSLEDLIKFYQKEIASTQKVLGRWNQRLQTYVDRQSQMEEEIASLSKEMDALRTSDAKRNKKEIARHGKQIERLQKDVNVINKDLKKQCGELASEVKDLGKESAGALKERFQQVYKEIGSDN